MKELKDLLFDKHLYRIQKKIALIGFSAACVAFVLNFLAIFWERPIDLFNVVALSIIACLFGITYFFDSRFLRILQISIFILVGLLILILSNLASLFGLILIYLGIILAYTLRLLKHQLKILLIVITVSFTLSIIFFLYSSEYFVAMDKLVFFYIILLLSIFSILLRNEFLSYINKSERTELYVNTGLKALELAHSLHLGTALNYAREVKRFVKNKDYSSLELYSKKIIEILQNREKMRSNFMKAVRLNNLSCEEPIELKGLILSILEIAQLDDRVEDWIYFDLKFPEKEIIFSAVPMEIFSVFQNLINNAIEGMIKIPKTKHILTVEAAEDTRLISILIKDTGPGFKKIPQYPFYGESDKKDIPGGFGLFYVSAIIAKNNGTLDITNTPPKGACVKCVLKKKGKL